MKIDPEYDLNRALATALRGKSPFVGIPLPGCPALGFDRARLQAALRGVTSTYVEVLTAAEYQAATGQRLGYSDFDGDLGRGGCRRYLCIDGMAAAGRIRTRVTLLAIHPIYWKTWEGRRALDTWIEQARKARVRSQSQIPFADRKQAARAKRGAATIKRLERELDKLGTEYELQNPAVPRVWTLSNGAREHLAERFHRLRTTKRQRTVVGAIAAQARREAWTSKRLYDKLTAASYDFTKMSGLTGKARERYGALTFHDYLKHLHRFVRDTGVYLETDLHHRLYERDPFGDKQAWGPERYQEKLADMRARQALRTQIASVRELLEQPSNIFTIAENPVENGGAE